MSSNLRIGIILVAVLGLLLGCVPPPAAVKETLNLLEVLTQTETPKTREGTTITGNCYPEGQKSISCNAGTSEDFIIEASGEVNIQFVSFGGSVGRAFGQSRDTGQQQSLPTPPPGTFYRVPYTITDIYKSGKVKMRNQDGIVKELPYTFLANCEIKQGRPEQFDCSDQPMLHPTFVAYPSDVRATDEPKPTQTAIVTPTPASKITLVIPSATPVPAAPPKTGDNPQPVSTDPPAATKAPDQIATANNNP